MPDDLTRLADGILGRRFRLEGRVWTVAAIVAGTRPWAWLVNMKRPEEQARMPLAAFEGLEPERKGSEG